MHARARVCVCVCVCVFVDSNELQVKLSAIRRRQRWQWRQHHQRRHGAAVSQSGLKWPTDIGTGGGGGGGGGGVLELSLRRRLRTYSKLLAFLSEHVAINIVDSTQLSSASTFSSASSSSSSSSSSSVSVRAQRPRVGLCRNPLLVRQVVTMFASVVGRYCSPVAVAHQWLAFFLLVQLVFGRQCSCIEKFQAAAARALPTGEKCFPRC